MDLTEPPARPLKNKGEPRAMGIDTVTREETPVMYAAASGTWDAIPEAAARAFQLLENALPPKGRKMIGYWHPPALQYRACYGATEGDNPGALGLEPDVIPGGRYRRARLKGDDIFARIPDAFAELEGMSGLSDDGRPWLEVYRRHDEVDVLVPVSG
jgi:DNA gyrase inhibitor GyrI